MRSSRALLLVMAAIAAVLWFTLRSTADEPADGSEQTDGEAAVAGRHLGGLDRSASRAPRSDLPARDQPRASVSGRVLDEAGRGVPNAQVCALTDSDELSQEQIRDVRCAVSARDGHFRLEGLHPVPYQITASAPTFIPGHWHDDQRHRLPLSAGQNVEGIEIVLEGGGVEIEGIVRDIAGGVIEDAWVRSGESVFFVGLGRKNAPGLARSDAEGAFSMWVKPGDTTLRAEALGYAPGTQRGAAPGHTFEIHLSPESVLVGRVVMAESGQPVEGAHVSLGRWSEGGTFTDADGRFRLDGLEPGSYKPIARSETAYGEPVKESHLGLGQQSDPIEIRMHPAGSVRGRVLIEGEQAQACAAGHVSLEDATHDRSHWDALRPDGSVQLDGLLPGTYKVDVRCEGYRSREKYDAIVVEAGQSIDMTWKVEEGRRIRGQLLDAAGTPVARVSVRATPQNVEGRGQRTSARDDTEANGEFELAGLLPGEYELTAQDGNRKATERATITDASDADGIRLTFATGATVRGVVLDADGRPVANVNVHDAGPVDDWVGKMTDDEGRFEYVDLPPGSHRFYATEGVWGSDMRAPGTNDDDVQGVSLDLVAGDEREIEVRVERQGGQIRGRVVDDTGGPVADAFIRAERESDSAAAGAGKNRQSARWGGWSETPVLTDQDGNFTLQGLPQDAAFTVYAHRKGGGEGMVEHVTAGTRGLEIAIEPTGSIAGKVRASDGSVPDELDMTVRNDEEGIHRGSHFFRTEGEFVFEELPPGKYEITASSADGDATTEVDVETGGAVRGVELVLVRRVTIKGRIVDADTKEPVGGLMVAASVEGGNLSFAGVDHGEDAKHITGADGRFELERGPTGKAQIMVFDRNWGAGKYDPAWLTRTIPDEDPADLGTIEVVARRLEAQEKAGDLGFKLKQNDAGQDWDEGDITIAVVRPGGPAATAGLAPGDVLESVDGHSLLGEGRSHYHTLTQVRPGTTLTFGLAGGRSVEVTAGKPL